MWGTNKRNYVNKYSALFGDYTTVITKMHVTENIKICGLCSKNIEFVLNF